jgi:putative zinc finger/helix-turn-helix YgiT family protein
MRRERAKRVNNMRDEQIECPKGHGKMVMRQTTEKISFRGISLKVPVEQYVCSVCGTKAGTAEQTDTIQKAIADAYRKSVGLLTSKEIVESRKKMNLTQPALAERMNVGIASIKKWEGETIQSKSMDQALRIALGDQRVGDSCTGNRTFSIPRIKLVMKEFESVLGRNILRKNDQMLFAAKYLWYADMVAHRETGESMTGSTYASLPYGPQLNNYKDLMDDIMKADESKAEPLSPEEKRIITRIALRFPEERMIYGAAHKEKIWKKQPNGSIIPYTDLAELTGL